MKLIEIGETGELPEEIIVDDFLREVVEATVAHYQRTGFKGLAVDGRVEIAYGTAPGHEGKGVSTALASELARIARGENANLTAVAQTLPEENASTSILKKLGFGMIRTVDHSEEGLVWEWELPADVPLPGLGAA